MPFFLFVCLFVCLFVYLFLFVCLFVCFLFFYYYFYFLFTSLLTPRVIQNHITQVFIYKSRFKLWGKKKKKRISFVSFFNISGCLIYYRVFVLIWYGLSPWLFHEYHWFFTLYSCSFLLKFNFNSYCILLSHENTKSHML